MGNDNLLDPVLDLEGEFYTEGHKLGDADGKRDGYNEGSIFAIEKGFEKFQEMGKMYGKAIVWAKRLPDQCNLLLHESSKISAEEGLTSRPGLDINNSQRIQNEPDVAASNFNFLKHSRLPIFHMNPRLEKHITAFLLLVDPVTLSMENTEEDIFNFDDRLRRGGVQAKILEKFAGEPRGNPVITSHTVEDHSIATNIEDI